MAFHVLHALAALTAIWGCMCVLNRMCSTSSMLLRAAHICFAVGAAGVLIAPVYLNRGPTTAELLMVYGVAVLSLRLAARRPLQVLARHPHYLRVRMQVVLLADRVKELWDRVRRQR